MGREALPVYAAVDISPSLAAESREVLTNLLPACLGLLQSSDTTHSVRCSVVTFSHNVQWLFRLTDWRHVDFAPPPRTGSGTSFAELFRFLRGEIADDLQLLAADNAIVSTVIILLFSDGQATGDWRAEHDALCGSGSLSTTPLVIPVGIGQVDRWIMSELGTLSSGSVIDGSGASAAREVCDLIRQYALDI